MISLREKLQSGDSLLTMLFLAAAVVGGAVALSPSLTVIITLSLVGVIVSGLIVVLRPLWILYGLVFFLPLISGVERGKLVPMLRPNEPLLLITMVMFILSPKKIKRNIESIRIGLVIMLYLLFGSVVPLLVYFLRGGAVDYSSLMPFLAPWQYLVLYSLIIAFDVTAAQARRCLQLLTLAGVIIALVAILQMMRVKVVTSILATYYYSGHLMRVEKWGYPRTTSLLANWHGTGIFLSFSVLVLLAYHVGGSRLFRSWIAGPFLVLLIAGMITTTSITSLVVLILGVIVILLASKGGAKRLLFFIPVLLLMTSFVFSDQISAQLDKQFANRHSFAPKTITYRIENWHEKFLPIIENYWLFGYGPKSPEDLVGVPSEDSQFVYMLLKGGILYVIAFLLFMISATRRLWYFYRHATSPQVRALFLAAVTLFVTIIPACFLQAYMTYSGVAEYLWILLGLSVAVQGKQISANRGAVIGRQRQFL